MSGLEGTGIGKSALGCGFGVLADAVLRDRKGQEYGNPHLVADLEFWRARFFRIGRDGNRQIRTWLRICGSESISSIEQLFYSQWITQKRPLRLTFQHEDGKEAYQILRQWRWAT